MIDFSAIGDKPKDRSKYNYIEDLDQILGSRGKMDVTEDAGFEESKHPRGQPENAGQFTSKGGGASASSEPENTSSGGGHIDISGYPENAKEITPEAGMAQASYRDIHSQMVHDLVGITGTDKPPSTVKVAGPLTSDSVGVITDNARARLSTYSAYLAGNTMDLMHQYINHMEKVLGGEGLGHLDSANLDAMMQDSVRKLVYQEVESNRQQFTDHGIRHIIGDIKRQDQLATALGGTQSPEERLMASFILVNHDIGYTTPLIREGGLRGVMMSGQHKHYSSKILEEQRDIWNEDKIFSSEQYDRILHVIDTHDSTELDKEDVLASSVRLADNLSLFSQEKLPGMFQYVDGGASYLMKLGDAARKNDTEAFTATRDKLYIAIDNANLSGGLKRDLKASVKELSYVTPKFTLGVLAGEISKISRDEGGQAVVEIHHNQFDAFLQKYFDMGQKQAHKLLGDYGYTDFSATEYDLGGVVKIRVVGADK